MNDQKAKVGLDRSGTTLETKSRDDAQLEALGIKSELQRSLGFLSNFATSFSYISVTTGTFVLFAFGIGIGGPAFFWAWPVVVIGQLVVGLNFAELASHFPVAGSIYQWSKRLSNQTLGWFDGWIYFWTSILNLTATALSVPIIISGIAGIDLTSRAPLGLSNMLVFLTLTTILVTTLVNAFGVRIMAFVNNAGVAAEILGTVFFAMILVIFFRHQPLSILTETRRLQSLANGNYLAVFAVAMFMSLYVFFGFDAGGTFGEETVNADREAPRGILWGIGISGVIGVVFLLSILLSFKDIDAAIRLGQAGGNPISDTIIANMGSVFGRVYLLVALTAVYVCTLTVHGATARLMFSMGRDRRLPLGRLWAKVNARFKTPVNAVLAIGFLAALPFIITDNPAILATGATGLIYLSYFLCNLGVYLARRKGWPQQSAWFKLGSWGKIINIVALFWGGIVLVNVSLWNAPRLFGDFGGPLRDQTNPLINTIQIGHVTLSSLPPIPIFQATLLLILTIGGLYYLVSFRGWEKNKVRGTKVPTTPGISGQQPMTYIPIPAGKGKSHKTPE